MTRFLLALALTTLGLMGCASKQKYVQNESASLKQIYLQSIQECGWIADTVYIDQCFEFDCRAKKFEIWDEHCNEIEFAHKFRSENSAYFK